MDLDSYYIEALRHAHDGKSYLQSTLEKVQEGLTDDAAKDVVQGDITGCKKQAERVKAILAELGERSDGKPNLTARSFGERIETVCVTMDGGPLRDAALSALLQQVKYAEQASFQNLIRVAECLGHNGHADQLKICLTEEEDAGELAASCADILMAATGSGDSQPQGVTINGHLAIDDVADETDSTNDDLSTKQ